jgi:hypothetical protein
MSTEKQRRLQHWEKRLQECSVPHFSIGLHVRGSSLQRKRRSDLACWVVGLQKGNKSRPAHGSYCSIFRPASVVTIKGFVSTGMVISFSRINSCGDIIWPYYDESMTSLHFVFVAQPALRTI